LKYTISFKISNKKEIDFNFVSWLYMKFSKVKPSVKLLLLVFIVFMQFLYSENIGTVIGTVEDAESQTPLPNVNILISGSDIGTVADINGEYRLNLPPGKYQIVFRCIGYQKEKREIQLVDKSTITLNVQLKIKPIQFKGIIVEESRNKSNINTNYKISFRSLQNVPQLGEPDMFEAIKALPGIYQTNDLKGNIHVRGGSSDQNQILLDGVEIHNPYHLLGLFSVFNVWAIEDVNIYPADFPVKHSGRLSSVIDIKTKIPPENRYMKANISLVSSSVSIAKAWEKRSMLLAYRRTYLDLLTAAMRFKIPYTFYDTNFKYTEKLLNDIELTVTGFYNKDRIVPEELDENEDSESAKDAVKWGNVLGSVGISKRNGKIKTGLSVSYSENFLNLDGSSGILNNKLNDISVKGNFQKNCIRQNISLGFQINKINSSYLWGGNLPVEEFFYEHIPHNFDYKHKVYHYGLYAQDNFLITQNLIFSSGLRFDLWDKEKTMSPRLSLEWKMSDFSSLKFAFGDYYQYFSQGAEGIEGSIIAPLFPNEVPSKAQTYSIGYFHKIVDLYKISIEVYQRYFRDVVKIQTDNFPSFTRGSGKTSGFDLLFQKKRGSITYQVSYTFQKSLETFEGVTCPTDWDSPHCLNGIIGFNVAKKWFLNTRISYRSGIPYTPIIGRYVGAKRLDSYNYLAPRFVKSAKNSDRLSDYFRLDVSLRKNYHRKNMDYVVYVQVLNLLNRGNILRYDWRDYWSACIITDMEGNIVRQGATNSLPIIPSIGVEFNF
jgi:hypothetical protein